MCLFCNLKLFQNNKSKERKNIDICYEKTESKQDQNWEKVEARNRPSYINKYSKNKWTTELDQQFPIFIYIYMCVCMKKYLWKI